MADDIFHDNHRAVDDHSKVERAKRQQVGRNVAKIEANGSEEQCEWNGDRNNKCGANISKKEKQDDDDEDDALGEVMHHRMGGEVQQVAAIEEGNNLHSRRQEMII